MEFYNESQKNGVDVVQQAMEVKMSSEHSLLMAFADRALTEHRGNLYYLSSVTEKIEKLNVGDTIIKNPYTDQITIIKDCEGSKNVIK